VSFESPWLYHRGKAERWLARQSAVKWWQWSRTGSWMSWREGGLTAGAVDRSMAKFKGRMVLRPISTQSYMFICAGEFLISMAQDGHMKLTRGL